MHNVLRSRVTPPQRLYCLRGRSDMEAADYRACANFGPIDGLTTRRESRTLLAIDLGAKAGASSWGAWKGGA